MSWEEHRRFYERMREMAKASGVTFVTAQQPKPDGAHSDPVPAEGPIFIDGVYLLPPRSK